MNLETKIAIYKFTPQVFTLTEKSRLLGSKFREFREYNAGIFTGMARLH